MLEAADFIQRVGFPIAVAVWLLYTTERMHHENLKALETIMGRLDLLTRLLAVIFKVDLSEVEHPRE